MKQEYVDELWYDAESYILRDIFVVSFRCPFR